MPKTRIPWRWKHLKRLALRLAEIRKSQAVDIFTDTKSSAKMLKDFIKELNKYEKLKKSGLSVKFVPSEKPLNVSVLGFKYDSYDCDGVRLNLLSDEWFDDYAAARKKHGWKPLALACDWADIDTDTDKISLGDRKRHRLIYQK